MEIEGAVGGRGGAVTVVQRTSADLKLNPHLHSVFLGGIFVAGPDGGDGKPVFHPLPRISEVKGRYTACVPYGVRQRGVRPSRFFGCEHRGHPPRTGRSSTGPGDAADMISSGNWWSVVVAGPQEWRVDGLDCRSPDSMIN